MERLFSIRRASALVPLVLAIVIIAMDQAYPLAADPKTTAVCQALRSAPSLDGKMISLRGVLRSTREDTWLVDEASCNVAANPAVNLFFGKRASSTKFGTLEKDEDTGDRLRAGIQKCGESGREPVVIFYGRFEGFPRAVGNDGHQYAYGGSGAFRVQLVVKSVSFVGCLDSR